MKTSGFRRCIVLIIALFASAVVFAHPAAASHTTGFSMNYVVSDDEFTDSFSLSLSGIQEFLSTQPGILKSYVHADGRTAAQVIFQAAQTYRISPKVLLANIQKESSMITRTTFPSGRQFYLDWIMFYGWCDSCSTGANKGFANQINSAADAFRRYLDYIAQYGYSISGWGPGITKNLPCIQSDYGNANDPDGRKLCTPGTTIGITPANAATAALYTYTPHPGGNFAFWYIWKQFGFGNRRIYPSGSLLRAQGSPNVWLIEGLTKRRFTNSAAFLSRYSFNRVIKVPPDHLFAYDTGREISYANYSLLKSPSGGVYLLADDTKRPIKTRQAFQNAGFRWEEVVTASWGELSQIPDGVEITTENVYPSGRLLQNKQSGAVFYIKDGQRYPIVCREIMRSQFGLRRPIPSDPTTIDGFPLAGPVGFKDGDLVTAGSTAYVIAQGEKLPIASPAAFNAFRFQWANIKKVTQRCLDVHPEGPLLDVDTVLRTASTP